MTQEHANPEDLDLYALGALDGEEKHAIESHLRACPECQQRLRSAREQSMLLGLSAPVLVPPPSIKAELMRKVRNERAAAARPAAVVRERRAGWGLSWAFALAAVILACIAGRLWYQSRSEQSQIQQLEAQIQNTQTQLASVHNVMSATSELVGAPDTVQVALKQQPGQPSGEAHVLYNPRLAAVLYSGAIAPAAADKSYQLWLVPSSGNPVDAGLVTPVQQGGIRTIRLPTGVAAKAFAVTLEPAGGRPQPTGPKVLVGALSS